MTPSKPKSVFTELGMARTIALLKEEIRELYCADDVPWIVGYSGGKDSTAVLQLTWLAIAELPPERRRKTIHVISTDTMVENPIVAAWVERSHSIMRENAAVQRMPVISNLLHPEVEESFWVNLIGKGYPAPRRGFRWCTERLKIRPSNRYIRQVVTDNGEAILLIGARKAESVARARVMKRNEKHRVRDRLSPSGTLPGCSIYTPIEDWSNDDVWVFLMQVQNAWGFDNKDLLTMYQGASPDGECPLVVDSSTPSCGDSRFGCWVCTLVDQDKSMTAMIQNDQEKEWMLPLLKLRNELDVASDHHLRDFRRMTGLVQLMDNGQKLVPGPYTQNSRETWLRKLLEAQCWIRKRGPAEVRDMQLISPAELQEIRRIWVVEKHEMEDSLPRIYQEATGEPYLGPQFDDNPVFGREEIELLREVCGGDQLHFEMTRELLSVERQQRVHARRSGLYEQMEKSIRRHYYDNEADALEMARRYAEARDKADKGQRGLAFEDCDLETENTAQAVLT
jgi:DNA sulfur modification protein DndC